jgi:hypothetical protein
MTPEGERFVLWLAVVVGVIGLVLFFLVWRMSRKIRYDKDNLHPIRDEEPPSPDRRSAE